MHGKKVDFGPKFLDAMHALQVTATAATVTATLTTPTVTRSATMKPTKLGGDDGERIADILMNMKV